MIETKKAEWHQQISKLQDMFLTLYRQDLELYVCIVRKNQLRLAYETTKTWESKKTHPFFRRFCPAQYESRLRQRRANQHLEVLQEERKDIEQRIERLLPDAQSLYHQIYESADQITKSEQTVTKTITALTKNLHHEKKVERDSKRMGQFNHFLRYKQMLFKGNQLRNRLLQYRMTMGLTNVEHDQYLERSSPCFFHQLFFLDENPINSDELTVLFRDFRTTITADRLFLPSFLEDSPKEKEQDVTHWLKTYDALNALLSHYWQMTLGTIRSIVDR